jgi:hypothetical protein
MRRCLGLVAVMSLFLGGCGSINISTEVIAEVIQKGAAKGVTYGLRALSKDQTSYLRVKDDSAKVAKLITDSIIPLIKGGDLKPVTVATANQALALLGTSLTPALSLVVQEAIDGVLDVLKLPDNPAAGLNDDQRMILVALFTGMVDGVTDFQSWPGPQVASKEFGPARGVTLAWKKGGILK